MAGNPNRRLYAEYIGALHNGVQFTNVPINPGVDFHFILAFAIDYTRPPAPMPTNGVFDIFWESNRLTPAAVADIKRRHHNVKVALSLGGATVHDKADVVFTVHNQEIWIRNAVSSLTRIIREYHIDGIDINYEAFQPDSVNTFVGCIGTLIRTLRINEVISFASIAPYQVDDVQRHYRPLWQNNRDVIDYVNFQFYAYGNLDVQQFLNHFDEQRANYDGARVLASFRSDGVGGLSPLNRFFNACLTLIENGKLPGIFAWCADLSFRPGNGFGPETQAQALLAHNGH